ncbi:MAG TPA: hypothetical protein VGM88_14025 [Kofleriaceae bacterium]|jgi:hypothetical protein
MAAGKGLRRRAHSRKAKGGLRAILGKAPSAAEVGQRLAWLARRAWKKDVTDLSTTSCTLQFVAGASPVRVTVLPDGDLEVRASTHALGPGYAAYVLARMAPVLEELEFVWAPDDEGDGKAAALAWLVERLREGADDPDAQVLVGMPAERVFLVDAPVLTALGPRDAAWRDAVLANPAKGADAFPWFEGGAGTEARAKALLAMWHELPWREPLDEDERAQMTEVDALLATAAKAKLPLPYGAWAELVELLGDGDRAEVLRAKAAPGEPPIGYRRFDMEVGLADGWSMTLGGGFVGVWDGDRYLATDGARSIEFTSFATTQGNSEALIAVAQEQYPVIERISDGPRAGRAEAYDQARFRVVHGLMAVAPHVAILTCRGDVRDEPWMLETWRSLRCES